MIIILLIVVIIFVIILCGASGNTANTNSNTSENTKINSSNKLLSDSINNDIRIMNDCLNLLNHSTNINTVISRYNDLLIVLSKLSEYENNVNVSFQSELPSEALARMHSEKAQIMNRAVQRAYDDMLHKSLSLKTDKGRKNRQIKFFNDLNDLMENFPVETQMFINDLSDKNISNQVTEQNNDIN